jgi:hypothetical protein
MGHAESITELLLGWEPITWLQVMLNYVRLKPVSYGVVQIGPGYPFQKRIPPVWRPVAINLSCCQPTR